MLKKDLGMQGYRASLVQELKEDDPALRIEWAELWLEKVRFLTRRNAITWAMTNPHISMDKPYRKKDIMKRKWDKEEKLEREKKEKLEREKDELQMKLAVVEQTGDNKVQELLWAMISGWV
eukprot:Em0019g447a